jgi:hypothetical protein
MTMKPLFAVLALRIPAAIASEVKTLDPSALSFLSRDD